MTYRGHIENGNVVFDSPSLPPDGSIVEIAVVTSAKTTEAQGHEKQTLGEKLLKFSGKAVGLPADAAEQHDHYLYGTPKR